MKTVLLTLAAVVLLIVAVVCAVAYGGFVDVSATGAHSAPVEWFLHTSMESAVHAGADELAAPPALDDPAKLRTGLVHYHSMCVLCHGAPGVPASEIAQGLNPMPPELYEHGHPGEEGAKETFWVVKNGIRMTGMPAFGPTHSDEDLWAITAFVQRLPDLSADEYAAMVRNAGLEPVPAGHDHGDGGHGGDGHDHGGGEGAAGPEDAPSGDADSPEGEDGHTHAPGEEHG